MGLKKYKDRNDLVNILEAIIDSSYDGLWICDREGKVIRINSASEKSMAYKEDQVMARRWWILSKKD